MRHNRTNMQMRCDKYRHNKRLKQVGRHIRFDIFLNKLAKKHNDFQTPNYLVCVFMFRRI